MGENIPNMLVYDPANGQSDESSQTNGEYVDLNSHPQKNAIHSDQLTLETLLGNVKNNMDNFFEFCTVMSKDGDEIVGGEGREQSVIWNRESVDSINCLCDSSLRTFGIAHKEEIKPGNFFNSHEEVSTLLKQASNDINNLEMELDNLKEFNGLFKKVLGAVRKLKSYKEEERDETMVESTSSSSSSDFSFRPLENRIVTSSPHHLEQLNIQ